MCGLAGCFGKTRHTLKLERDLLDMGKVIEHRGPDDTGIWYKQEVHSIGLVRRRLSIIDLSKAGHQPMTSSSGRYVVSYNGEIYNHLELRQLIDKMGVKSREMAEIKYDVHKVNKEMLKIMRIQ